MHTPRLLPLLLLFATAASAGTVTLNFEGANSANYYDQAGHNFGVVFSQNVFFFNTSFYNNPANAQYIDPTDANCAQAIAGVCVQTSGNWSNNTIMAQFPSGPNTPVIMNVLGGFDHFLQFTSSGADVPTTVDIFSGLDGQGTLLAVINLPVLDPWSYDTEFDAVHGGIFLTDFNGLAHSVVFNGGTQTAVVDFDDVSFDAVPEPGTLVLFGSGVLGIAVQLRRRLQS